MILYHGTNVRFDTVDLTKCRPYKDFGKGFYLTDIEQQAINMAERRCDFEGNGVPCVIKYTFDESLLHSEDLKILVFDGVSIEWAQFIVSNRDRNGKNHHSYDIVVGPVADDGVVYQINRYLQHIITLEVLVEELRYKNINNQYCFCSPKAISYLQRI